MDKNIQIQMLVFAELVKKFKKIAVKNPSLELPDKLNIFFTFVEQKFTPFTQSAKSGDYTLFIHNDCYS